MTSVSFRQSDDPPGVRVIDDITASQFTLETAESVELESVDVDDWPVPVERGVRFRTERIEDGNGAAHTLRDEDGNSVEDLYQRDRLEVGEGVYHVELGGAVKAYVRLTGPFTIRTDSSLATFEFDEPHEAVLGARPNLHRPTTTVTTTSDPADLARAVSTFGSALQATSPERSYASLRGHPPALEVGDTLHIPDDLSVPETGVTVEVPPDLGSVMAAAPLVYYLAATCRVGDDPAVRTDRGFSMPLSSRSLADDVSRLLRRTFVLDCFARTHGHYPYSLREYEAVKSALPVDLEAAYDTPLAERLEAYAAVPDDLLTDAIPRWSATAFVEPEPDSVTALPYLVDQLAVVRPESPPRYAGSPARRIALESFVQGPAPRGAKAVFNGETSFVDVPETDSLAQLWVGNGIPLNANHVATAGHRNRRNAGPVEDHSIKVTVVCNDSAMTSESSAVNRVYGTRDHLPFELTTHQNLGTEALAEVIQEGADFLHYVGHATAEGLECRDGRLDVSTLDSVGPKAFLLNACQSYHQGLELVERGSFGGIVTLSDVPEMAALETGRLVARLLDTGWTLRAALHVARSQSVVGGQYVVVGDDQTSVAQAATVVTHVSRVTKHDDDTFEIETEGFESGRYRLGAVIGYHYHDGPRHILGNGAEPALLSRAELRDHLEAEDIPVLFEGDLHWSYDLADVI